MKHTKIKHGVSLAVIFFLLIGSLALAFGLPKLAKDSPLANAQVQVEISKEPKDGEYAFGDIFVMPSCTFNQNGKSAQGLGSLQFPDGSEYKDSETTLNQSGEYTLKYIAELDGKKYTKEYPFTVSGKLATYGSSKTTVEYGKCTAFGAGSTGLTLRIANGDAVTFAHVFDMTEMTMATKIVEGFVLPDVQGKADFARMVFTFTDIEDPSVQLTYFGNFHDDSNAYGLTFFTAAGNGQVQCGLEYAGKLHKGATLGCLVPHSFMAMDTGLYYGAAKPTPAKPDDKLFCISYDDASKQAWAGGKIISDLDDSYYYDKLWFGFPSGKAKLTVSGANYNNATANICLTEVLGVDLSAETLVDNDLPTITVDNEYETMPTAIVGGSYPVPKARASDLVSGACDVNVSVWYNYGTDAGKMVSVTNGRFQVEKVGTYAIVYEATDHNGNTAREVLWVRSELGGYVTPLAVEFAPFDSQIEVGTMQSLPQATVLNARGNYTLTYEISKGRKDCAIVDGKFCLEEKGDWILTCTAVDYVGQQAVAVVALEGIVSGKPVIVDELSLPVAYISGATYELPLLHAYDYSTGEKVEKLCEVVVEYNGQKKTYTSGDTFVPAVETHQDKIKISYICDGAEMVPTREVPVFVVFDKERIPGNVERYRDVIRVENYFYTQSDVTLANGYSIGDIEGLKMTANAQADIKLAFANAQMVEGFALDFLTVPNEGKFEQMAITLTDSKDSAISVKAVFTKDDGQTILRVGDARVSLNLDFDGALSAAYSFGFAKGNFTVNSTTAVTVTKMDNGKAFDGFPSGKVYFEIEMLSAESGASLFLQKISGVNVSNKQDNTGAVIMTANPVVMNAFKDSTYTVQKVLVGDVLCPNVDAKVTVTGPNGEVVTSVDGVALSGVDATVDYEIVLAEYGAYTVSVEAKEGGGWKLPNKSYYEYLISVIDGEKPTITFAEEFASKIKVGELLIIPKYEVSDNFSTAENITVMTVVTNPKGMPVYVYGDSNAVRCEYEGVYKIKIFVYDEMGNLTTFETSVTVE